MDTAPRTLDGRQVSGLIRVSRAIESMMQQAGVAADITNVLRHREDSAVSNSEEAQHAIAVAESKYKAIFENAVIGIFQTTSNGRYLSANTALARMYGFSGPNEMIDGLTDIKRQLYVDPSLRTRFVTQLAANDYVTNFEAEVYRVDGSTIWISETARAVRDPNGRLLFYEGTVQDISERKRAEEEIRKLNVHLETRLQRIEALREIDNAITSTHDRGLVLNVCLDQVLAQLRVDAADILLGDVASHMLEYAAGKGMRAGALHRAVLPLGIGLAGKAAIERRTISVPNLSQAPDKFPHIPLLNHEEFVSYHAVPLISKGEVRGVLEVFHRSPLNPDDEWIGFLEAIATQVAIAVDNNSLFTSLQRSNNELTVAYDSTIEGWSKALDLRDRETEGHTQRVTEMTVRLARTMGIDESELVHIRRGALLHDIGKMGVPDNILHKPGPLTDDEWLVMRKHPQHAYDWLEQVPFLGRALDIPRYHHEKWDGTGYPDKLSGTRIPLSARIFAIVDVWDALRSDRPYRSGWPEDKVLRHIEASSGTHFDPIVVESFLSLFPDYKTAEEDAELYPDQTDQTDQRRAA
jgi:PAS domain S-box-containing protein